MLVKRVGFVLFLAWIFILPTAVLAQGTAAGSLISNVATVTYEMNGISLNAISNTAVDQIDQLLDLQVVWSDVSNVAVAEGDSAKALTFTLANLGNGTDQFALTTAPAPTSDFAITSPQIYRDTNGNGVFDISLDQIISNVTLAADEVATLFVVGDIPTGTSPANAVSKNLFTVRSLTGGSGVAGTIYAGAGIDGSSAVDGVRGGVDETIGVFQVNSIGVLLVQSSTTAGADLWTGSIVTYTLEVSFVGEGVVDNLIVNDPIPAGTTYVAGSLKLDEGSLSDAVDADKGSFDGQQISVDFGTVSQSVTAPFVHHIAFKAQIQ